MAACGGGFVLAVVVGGFVGPTIAVFAIVYLAGSALIEFERAGADSRAESWACGLVDGDGVDSDRVDGDGDADGDRVGE